MACLWGWIAKGSKQSSVSKDLAPAVPLKTSPSSSELGMDDLLTFPLKTSPSPSKLVVDDRPAVPLKELPNPSELKASPNPSELKASPSPSKLVVDDLPDVSLKPSPSKSILVIDDLPAVPLKPSPSPSKLAIDDLPDILLIEILDRLPCVSVARCKCVSKHWLNLISNPYFVCHYRCHQRGTLIFSAETNTNSKQKGEWEFLAMSESEELLELKIRRFSLSFLPLEEQPYVLGMLNGLVLCCPSWTKQSDYYICNPYTMQWVALPCPPSACSTPGYMDVLVGFICDPNRSTATTSSSIMLNANYRRKVVRIPPFTDNSFKYMDNSFKFKVEIFSSEIGQWRESVVSSPRDIRHLYSINNFTGFAYNGMLYWPGGRGMLIRLNLFNNINNNTSTNIISCFIGECHFVKFDQPTIDLLTDDCLGMYEGRLRLCRLIARDFLGPPSPTILCVWELKEEDLEMVDGGKYKWCLIEKIFLDQIISESPLIAEWEKSHEREIRLLALDPNNEEIVYLDMEGHIVMFNIRTKEFMVATKCKRSSARAFLLWSQSPENACSWRWGWTKAFPSVHSCWSTCLLSKASNFGV